MSHDFSTDSLLPVLNIVLFMKEQFIYLLNTHSCNTGYTQKNGSVSKVYKKFISHLTRVQCTPSAAATVQVSHVLPAVRFSCLLQDCRASFQDGVTASFCYILRCPDLWLQCRVSFVHGSLALPAVLNCARDSRYTVITDLDTSKRSTQKPFPAVMPFWKLAPWSCINPLPVQFKSLLPGQEGCVFFSPQQQTNIPTLISITYFDAYAWIMFIHVQICLLSDFITSGNIELLFRSHNAVFMKRTASAF
jgi:hypothetical protein